MGRVIVSGAGRMKAPLAGISVNTLPIGQTIKFLEDDTYVDFMIVHKGNPDTNLYDSSCNGIWVLRKDILKTSRWDNNETSVNYDGSIIYEYFTDSYIPSLGAVEQNIIKQVNIPCRYRVGTTDEVQQTNVKAFLLSVFEVGGTITQFPGTTVDGAYLEYFKDNLDAKRIAQYDDQNQGKSNYSWWLRTSVGNSIWFIYSDGSFSNNSADVTYGVRPAIILPNSAKVNDNYELVG